MDNSRCNNGNSEEHYSSECDPTGYWQNGGEHCCNPYDYTIYTNEICKGCSGSCGDICIPDSPIKVVSAGEYCKSTTQAASSAAYDAYARAKKGYKALVDARICPQMVCNDYVEATATKQGCPSNCTAPTASAYWSAGGNNGAWCECDGDKAALTAAAQASANALAQEKANAKECDCPEVKTWSANVTTATKNCSSSHQLISTVPYTLSYTNPCGSSKSITVEVGGRPNDIIGDVSASRTVTVPSGSGTTSGRLSLPQDCLCNTAYAIGISNGNCQ